MKVYLLWFIINAIDYHILDGIYKTKEKALIDLHEKQNKHSTEIFE